MDTLKAVLETKTGTIAQGLGGIGISYIEAIPAWLRIGILIGVFINVWLKLLREIRNN